MGFVEGMVIEVSRATVPDRPHPADAFPRFTYARRWTASGRTSPTSASGSSCTIAPARPARRQRASASSTRRSPSGGPGRSACAAPGMAGAYPPPDRRPDRAGPAITARKRPRHHRGPAGRRDPFEPREDRGRGAVPAALAAAAWRRRRGPRAASSPTRTGWPRRCSGQVRLELGPRLGLADPDVLAYCLGPPLPDVPVGHRGPALGRHPQPLQRAAAGGRGQARDGFRGPRQAVTRRTPPARRWRSSTTSCSTAGSSVAARSASTAATCWPGPSP